LSALRTVFCGVSLGLCLFVVPCKLLNAAETPIPEMPSRWVTDTAGFMSSGAAAALNGRLAEYERSTGHQLIVYIGQTTGDASIEEWAVRAFEKWKVGKKGIDDGLVLFIMAADRKLRFEVGYGLESVIPDAVAFRVIDQVIVPRVQAGDRDGAVTAGMDAMMTVIGGGGLPSQSRDSDRDSDRRRPITLIQLIGYSIVGIVILFILVTNPSLAIYLLASILSSGGHGGRRGGGWHGGGGGFGGGGFGGGGGRSGGGGATGSW